MQTQNSNPSIHKTILPEIIPFTILGSFKRTTTQELESDLDLQSNSISNPDIHPISIPDSKVIQTHSELIQTSSISSVIVLIYI